jgi:translation initiation factor 1A
MPKNMGKGGKNRKRGTNKNEQAKRELVVKEEGQEYGQILKNLGNNRLEVHLIDGTKRIGVIRGAIRRKMWICVGDIVLVGIRDFEEGKVDVLSRYSADEAKQLIKEKHIPAHMHVNDDEGSSQNRVVDFVAMEDDDDDDDEENTAGQQHLPDLTSDDEDEYNIDDI